jgi:aminopeptidase N
MLPDLSVTEKPIIIQFLDPPINVLPGRPKVIKIGKYVNYNCVIKIGDRQMSMIEYIGAIQTNKKTYFLSETAYIEWYNRIHECIDSYHLLFGLTNKCKAEYDFYTMLAQLEKKYNHNDTLLITIQYTAKPDEKEKGGSAAIKDDKGLYFINTSMKESYKPTQIWTQGETESNSCWFPTIDNPNEKFTSTLSVSVNKEMTILSNGEKTSSVIEGNTKTEKWENKLPMPAYLTMMAIGEFDIIVDSLNGKEVSYYLEKQYAPYARNIFKHTPEMIAFFGEKLGFQYPWNKYVQVVVRDYVSGAMENTSATLHGDFVQKNNRQLIDASNDDIIAHELFHQWFGDLVTCKTWSHLVLNEGFATLGEQIWIEHKYGKEEALKKSYNRIQRYINYTNKNSDDAIVNSNYNSQEDMFNVLTYQKGASVLNLLKNEIGEDAFFLGLKNYLTTYQFSNTEIDDLKKEFEKVIGRELNLFFNQWFLRGGHPILDIRYVYNDSSKLAQVIVEQVQKNEVGLFNFPLEFKIKQGNKTQSFVFQIEKKKEIFFVEKLDLILHLSENSVIIYFTFTKF